MIVEIYFEDLTNEKQREILDILGIEGPEEMNWDVFPIDIWEFSPEVNIDSDEPDR